MSLNVPWSALHHKALVYAPTASPERADEVPDALSVPVPASPQPSRQRLRFGRVWVDVLSFAEALRAIEALVDARQGGSVFTPNVDHVVKAESNEAFRRAYDDVSLSLADGMPLIWSAPLLGCPLPERVAGSDLLMPVLEMAARRKWRVYLLGGAPGVAPTGRARPGCAGRPDLRGAGAAEAGAVDPPVARGDSSCGRARRRGVARLPGGQVQARARMDAALRSRVGVSPLAGAAAVVAALPGRGPPLSRHRAVHVAAPAPRASSPASVVSRSRLRSRSKVTAIED
jgi:hypothetical protein